MPLIYLKDVIYLDLISASSLRWVPDFPVNIDLQTETRCFSLRLVLDIPSRLVLFNMSRLGSLMAFH